MEEEIKRRKERTSFGPEENHLLYEILDNRKNDAKQTTKQDLLELINERTQRQEYIDKLERSLDTNMIDQVVTAFHEEQRERKALDL